jgi:chromosome segregation ATPase
MAVPLVMQQNTIKELRAEVDALKQQVAQLAPLQEQLDRANQDAANAGGSAESQKHELVRLRAEVAKLRDQAKSLGKAEQEVQSLKDRLTSSKATLSEQEATLQAQNRRMQSITGAQHVNTCINNLRLIDSAKQQWALENKKAGTDTPEMSDLLPYFGQGASITNLPTCPDGGSYTIGTVNDKPTCSIPGHNLP